MYAIYLFYILYLWYTGLCVIWNDAGWTIVLYRSTFHEFVLPVFWNHTLTNLLNRTEEPPKVLSLLFECSSKVQNVIQVAPMAFGARRRRTWCFRCIIYLTLLFKRWGMCPLEMLDHNSSRRIPCSISNISNRRIGDIDHEFFYSIGVVPVKGRVVLVEAQTV